MVQFLLNYTLKCGNSSVGRALPCQGKGRGFESRFPLQITKTVHFSCVYAPCLYYPYFIAVDTKNAHEKVTLMKSIIEEASSITKAIENAWKRADQPAEFSVRIFEIPQKNLFGFTTKSAKIGIFFEETKKREKPKLAPKQKPKRAPVKQAPKAAKPKKETDQQDPWNKEMVAYTQDWLNSLFKQLRMSNTSFSIDPQRYHLKVVFDQPIFEQEEKNRAFFRNCAHLMMQSVRNTFKRPLKGFKVILTVK